MATYECQDCGGEFEGAPDQQCPKCGGFRTREKPTPFADIVHELSALEVRANAIRGMLHDRRTPHRKARFVTYQLEHIVDACQKSKVAITIQGGPRG